MLELSGAAHDRMTLSYVGDNLNTAVYFVRLGRSTMSPRLKTTMRLDDRRMASRRCRHEFGLARARSITWIHAIRTNAAWYALSLWARTLRSVSGQCSSIPNTVCRRSRRKFAVSSGLIHSGRPPAPYSTCRAWQSRRKLWPRVGTVS